MYLCILMKFDVNLPLFWDMDAYVQRIEGAIIVPSKMQKHTLTCNRNNSSGHGYRTYFDMFLAIIHYFKVLLAVNMKLVSSIASTL